MKKFLNQLKWNLSLFLILFVFAGCATTYDALKPTLDPPTAFLPDPGRMETLPATAPFRKAWFDKKLDWSKYTKIYVAPVSTKYMEDDKWWEKINTAEATNLKKSFSKIAEYMQDSFKDAVNDDGNHRFQVADAPGADTIVLEMAIVELVPTRGFFNAAENVAGFFIPGANLLTLLNAGHVAMEARMRDGESNNIIGLLADKEMDRRAIIDVAGLSWWEHAKLIIDNWSQQYVKAMANGNEKDLQDQTPFALFSL